ncbi:MAG: hypothetical protein GC180_02020 [Bacteroidetes bacterium]|nr:hypothetical protein [Bacteroidota bacterium]
MIKKETLARFRLPFSFFLLPVFMFAWSQNPGISEGRIILMFLLLHLLIYPAGNGYIQLQEQGDEVGAKTKNIAQLSRQLKAWVMAIDAISILIATWVSLSLALQVLVFILAIRVNAMKSLRNWSVPILSWLWVSFFYGSYIYWIVQCTFHPDMNPADLVLEQVWAKLSSSFFLGAFLPFSRIYRHSSDKANGVKSLSMLFGYKMIFVFSFGIFALAEFCAANYFFSIQLSKDFWVLQLFLLPIEFHMLYWFRCIWKDESAVNFDWAIRTNFITSSCLNLYFFCLILTQ